MIAALLRLIGRIPAAYRWLRQQATLRGCEVEADRARVHLSVLRKALLWVLIPDLVLGGILVYRWPAAKAQALRILIDRQVVQADLAVHMFDQGIAEVTHLAYLTAQPEALAQPHGQAQFRAKVEILDRLKANREAMGVALDQAKKVQVALPSRLWGWTPWTDPLTGQAFPAIASRSEIADGLYQTLANSDEQRGWLLTVAVASKPNDLKENP